MSSSSETGIPTGLNRIKTPRESIRSVHRCHNSELYDQSDKSSLISADDDGKILPTASLPPPPSSSKQKFAANSQSDYHEFTAAKPGYYRGKKKITAWLSSYLSKESNQTVHNTPRSIEVDVHARKIMDKEGDRKMKVDVEGMSMGERKTFPDAFSSKKVSKDIKSFSHELGLGGGFTPIQPRVHSYDDLQEHLGSFHVRFDEAKDVVNVELVSFSQDVVDYLEQNESTGQEMAEELLILAQNCIEMTSFEFQVRCEEIVQGLTESRQICQTGLLKWLFTRILFILTRCTRLLQFQKNVEPIDEKEFHKFKQILKSIPAVESNCLSNSGIVSTSSAHTSGQRVATESCKNEQNKKLPVPKVRFCRFVQSDDVGVITNEESMVFDQESLFRTSQIEKNSHVAKVCEPDDRKFSKPMNESSCDYEKLQSPDRCHSVICRICEKMVPASHLEPHSYLCAHADKCDTKLSTVDECLCKLADVLERIVESRNNLLQSSSFGPENSRLRPAQNGSALEGYSPRTSEWENKCVEGMIEDLHEMDTAEIDDHLPNVLFLKGPLSIKFSTYGRSSSTGSMTSGSSTNTPKSTHFDLFWLEHYNGTAEEDVVQMSNLADIARCMAATDISEEGCCDILTAYMHDLQELIEQSKLKALVVDTFSSRVEILLREKYVLACELIDPKLKESDGETNRSPGILVDEPSQSSAVSTPVHTPNKERTNIGDFEIIKPISRGAFGKVFLARKRTTRDLFAIKVLKKLDMICKNDIERILSERNILIAVRNPFVVRFYYSFTSRDNLYLVMEYLNGGDLYSLLRKVGCLEEDVGRIYVAELVLALEYIHSLGIVHRDLKPGNILIAHDGHIKLTDFGLSKFGLMNSTSGLSGSDIENKASLDVLDHNVQRTEAAVGTPDYLAPEILLGTEHGYAADWWSVGIILFELITGIPPFSANSAEVIFNNILNRKIPWPPIPSYMSHEAQDLITRFLIEDPEKRLGAQGSSEVKSHPFFKGVNWDTLALQKAAFIPQPDAIDDTSYFVSRNNQSFRMFEDQVSSDSAASVTNYSCSDVEVEMDECGELAEFDYSPIDLSLMNFSFKNLSQLASINRDVLLKTERDATKHSSSS